MLHFGPDHGPLVVVSLPLFEEANRTRAFAVTVLRELAGHGIGGALPDLPGQGESTLATECITLATLRAGFAAACAALSRPCYSFAIRSGALLDGEAQVNGRYHLSPMTGADLRRELVRARQASARETGVAFDPATIDTSDAPMEFAGNRLSPAFLRELSDATPMIDVARTVRLATEAKPADFKIAGSPLWRRAEPDNDPEFAAHLANDIAAWVRGA